MLTYKKHMNDLRQDIIRLKLSSQDIPEVNIDGLPVFKAGCVWIVGAGPGDAGLLTLHAVNALQQADVIIYDALVSEDILALARIESEKIYAGKRGGKPSCHQNDISNQIVDFAKLGKRVLRLKGGDPFVFGRGGEEAKKLVEEQIEFRIIPGISAGIGGLAYAGIPLTHRDVNHAVTFVTGHLAGNSEEELLDWQAIAQGSPVIVLYMAMSRLAVIVEILQNFGRSAEDPIAIVTQATMPEQKIFRSHLGTVIDDIKGKEFSPPAIIVVGQIVEIGKMLEWFHHA